jgi:DNA-binding PucR family transcriptional regulator
MIGMVCLHLVATVDEQTCVVSGHLTAPTGSTLHRWAAGLTAAVSRRLPGKPVIQIGVGNPQPGLADAHRSAHQARIALRTVRQVREFDGVGVWSELGEYAVLAQLPPEALEDSPVDEPIERLSEGDPSGRLRQTLLTFLDHAGSIPRTADSLHLHRTSLYYRLNQISRLTGVDLDDGRTRFRLQLALRLADLRRTQH